MTRLMRHDDTGAAAVILVLLTPVLFALAGLVLDGGRAIAARQRSADIAEQAARAGVNALDVTALRATGSDAIDPTAARTAACRYVAVADPGAACQVVATPQRVTVTVTGRTSTVLLGLVGINTFHVAGTAAAEPVRGVVVQEGS